MDFLDFLGKEVRESISEFVVGCRIGKEGRRRLMEHGIKSAP